MQTRQLASCREGVPGLAHGPHDVPVEEAVTGSGGAHGLDPVDGVIERRAYQVVHGGIDDGEPPHPGFLSVDHARHKHTCRSRDIAARLEYQFAVQRPDGLRDHLRVVLDRRRYRAAVVNAQSAAQVELADVEARLE